MEDAVSVSDAEAGTSGRRFTAAQLHERIKRLSKEGSVFSHLSQQGCGPDEVQATVPPTTQALWDCVGKMPHDVLLPGTLVPSLAASMSDNFWARGNESLTAAVALSHQRAQLLTGSAAAAASERSKESMRTGRLLMRLAAHSLHDPHRRESVGYTLNRSAKPRTQPNMSAWLRNLALLLEARAHVETSIDLAVSSVVTGKGKGKGKRGVDSDEDADTSAAVASVSDSTHNPILRQLRQDITRCLSKLVAMVSKWSAVDCSAEEAKHVVLLASLLIHVPLDSVTSRMERHLLALWAFVCDTNSLSVHTSRGVTPVQRQLQGDWSGESSDDADDGDGDRCPQCHVWDGHLTTCTRFARRARTHSGPQLPSTESMVVKARLRMSRVTTKADAGTDSDVTPATPLVIAARLQCITWLGARLQTLHTEYGSGRVRQAEAEAAEDDVRLPYLNMLGLFQEGVSDRVRDAANATIAASGDFTMLIMDEEGTVVSERRVLSQKLKARSSYFRLMLDSSMREARNRVIEIRTHAPKELGELIDYLYTRVIEITAENCMQFLMLANEFSVVDIKSAASAVLMHNLDRMDAETVWQVAQASELSESTMRSIRSYVIEELVVTPAIENDAEALRTTLTDFYLFPGLLASVLPYLLPGIGIEQHDPECSLCGTGAFEHAVECVQRALMQCRFGADLFLVLLEVAHSELPNEVDWWNALRMSGTYGSPECVHYTMERILAEGGSDLFVPSAAHWHSLFLCNDDDLLLTFLNALQAPCPNVNAMKDGHSLLWNYCIAPNNALLFSRRLLTLGACPVTLGDHCLMRVLEQHNINEDVAVALARQECDAGAYTRCVPYKGSTPLSPLFVAIDQGCIRLAEALLQQQRVEPNQKFLFKLNNRAKMTTSVSTPRRGADFGFVVPLGSSVDAQADRTADDVFWDVNHVTALTRACMHQDSALAQTLASMLLAAGADINAPGVLSPLCAAAFRGHDLVAYLMEAGVREEVIGNALRFAAAGGHAGTVELLMLRLPIASSARAVQRACQEAEAKGHAAVASYLSERMAGAGVAKPRSRKLRSVMFEPGHYEGYVERLGGPFNNAWTRRFCKISPNTDGPGGVIKLFKSPCDAFAGKKAKVTIELNAANVTLQPNIDLKQREHAMQIQDGKKKHILACDTAPLHDECVAIIQEYLQ